MEPYVRHPQLFPALTACFRADTGSPSARRELLRVLGIVGALDPYAMRQVRDTTQRERQEPADDKEAQGMLAEGMEGQVCFCRCG